MKVLIIGGGASGMMAALTAAEQPDNTVTLLERQARVGRKLLATGNGRCNLTNLDLAGTHYHGARPEFAVPVLSYFGLDDTLRLFRSLGLLTVADETGRVYPLSDQANSVVDVLRFALQTRGVNVVCSCDVIEVKKKARGYEAIAATGERYFGDRLIVAAGGCAGKKLGGTKSGYHLLGMLGHSVTALSPSLTQIRTDPTHVRALKGVRADALVRLRQNGQLIAQEAGEVQFTDFGLSGPVAFSLSRAAGLLDGAELSLDFLRAYAPEDVDALLKDKRAAMGELPAEDFLSGILPSRLGSVVMRRALGSLQRPASALTDAELTQVRQQLRCFTLPVTGVMGMENAQVTAGGIVTDEFDPQTLESRLAPGVFATGEVLDIDGDCGGYNLQWAWSSGRLAGMLGTREETV
ncbi:MAG: NAD(P)/FAD-dependent oxidoreductase [Clostridiales bacterium]|nr:NAD(P)/FAD-dependent oxidoreductase [Clostridiales bacterium]